MHFPADKPETSPPLNIGADGVITKCSDGTLTLVRTRIPKPPPPRDARRSGAASAPRPWETTLLSVLAVWRCPHQNTHHIPNDTKERMLSPSSPRGPRDSHCASQTRHRSVTCLVTPAYEAGRLPTGKLSSASTALCASEVPTSDNGHAPAQVVWWRQLKDGRFAAYEAGESSMLEAKHRDGGGVVALSGGEQVSALLAFIT